MSEVVLLTPISDHFLGVAEFDIQAALRGQNMAEALPSPGTGAAMVGRTLRVEDLAGYIFGHQGAEVTKKGPHSESREDQSKKQEGRGQVPGRNMDIHSDGKKRKDSQLEN